MTPPIAASTIPAQAFRFLELAPLSSFADESPEAAAAAAVYPEALRMALEIAEWSFASRIVTLPEAQLLAGDAADPDLPHVYLPPPDLVALREVHGLQVQWRLDMGYIRCTEPGPLRIRYTSLIQNETRMPATFRTLVAAQMALLLAGAYLTTRTKQVDLESRLERLTGLALRQDGRNASPQSAWDDDHEYWDREAVR
ncbi:hypothetical protein [Roseicyclus amphidinii]|uniref:hypothetical protein n=1 Tax=Roseicyclus amphidinii TaxID=3034232 RepID=UPI0024E0DCD8|nr:hypothetical protein [Roseicyclus sp. Amp-Y-6]